MTRIHSWPKIDYMKYVIKEDVIKKEDENGDFLLVNIFKEDDSYYKVTGAAKFVWQKMGEGLSREDIVKEMLNRFNTTEEQIHKDLDHFLTDLLQFDLIAKSE